MTRTSLYPHELAVVERLTIELSRQSDRDSELVGPQIFAALVDVLYARGNWAHTGKRFEYAPTVKLPDAFVFEEVRGAIP